MALSGQKKHLALPCRQSFVEGGRCFCDPLALADIAGYGETADQLVILHDVRDVCLDPDLTAILSRQVSLEEWLYRLTCPCPCRESEGLFSSLASEQGEDRPSAKLLRFVAGERRRTGVAEDQPAVEIEKKDRIHEILSDQPVTLLGLAKSVGQMLTLARLVERGQKMLDLERLYEKSKGEAVDCL